MTCALRVLFLADTHLGFDWPVRPRVQRHRRGDDFFANYLRALEPAMQGEVDLVVHGGDVFDRPKVLPTMAYQVLTPLVRVAERGIPVVIVPGNHERAVLPHARFALHPNVHVFDRPRTCVLAVRGQTIALAGFPYTRRVRAEFPRLLEQCGWRDEGADLRLLCMHHCVEGATVGPGNFMFTTARDVVRLRDIPPDFSAVLSGHIHRRQVLTRDLRGRSLDTPVLYPGSVERTSSAEIGEQKGFMLLQFEAANRLSWEFRQLPTRPFMPRQYSFRPRRMRSNELRPVKPQLDLGLV